MQKTYLSLYFIKDIGKCIKQKNGTCCSAPSPAVRRIPHQGSLRISLYIRRKSALNGDIKDILRQTNKKKSRLLMKSRLYSNDRIYGKIMQTPDYTAAIRHGLP